MFCNMVRAYEDRSNGMKKLVRDLEPVYDLSLTAGIGERDPEKTAETPSPQSTDRASGRFELILAARKRALYCV